ncbi:Similar to DNA-binding protein REB1; acc. no. Q05950 [Pyronema omphalodes CBS 100304]|uniref:Similar to DNA-binding protein REB1 acc. no. Q05950 n=1 Tax=Pyronema omphalodes (strain CBS 100304) TaxID=1076935 RepID=U4L9F6_PYROM|nr:Similar to DNA-binding protein REB1; acc. no. Q05950 [Pyronema omphalodes CBS 100304]
MSNGPASAWFAAEMDNTSSRDSRQHLSAEGLHQPQREVDEDEKKKKDSDPLENEEQNIEAILKSPEEISTPLIGQNNTGQELAVGSEILVEGEKKKKRKKHRTKNQSEGDQQGRVQETAEALVNLSSEAGVGKDKANDQEKAGAEETKKKKKRSKKHRGVDESAMMDVEENLVPSQMEASNQNADTVDTSAVLADPTVAAFTDALSNVPEVQLQLPTGNNIPQAVAPMDQSGLQDILIPDQQIITEHLAAHMAKMTHPAPQQQPAEDMLEQRIMTELAMVSSDGFVPVNQSTGVDNLTASTAAANKSAQKRKRPNIPVPINPLVDPQLMQLDQQAALVTTADINDPNNRSKKRMLRPGPASDATILDEVLEEEDMPETPDNFARRAYKRKPANPGEGKISWDNTPSASTPVMVNGGTFSLEERHTIDMALNEYRKVHSMSMDELKDRVWGNTRKKDEFWDTICNSVPSRSRASVYKHVRRSCHIFEQRAKWTPEEDAELASLVAEKGNKWKDIGDALGRMGEDCRDRYRNYVKCGNNRGTDRWSEMEETLLRNTVEQHKEETRQIFLQEGKELPPPEKEDTVLINWTIVSDKMENKRSRIQCRYKWKKMLAQKEKVKAAPLGVTYVGGKKKRLTYDISAMLPGDKQWLLVQIRNSHATQENQIPWDLIAKYDKDVGIWTHKDLKNAYKKFREHIPHKRRPLAEILKQLLQEIENEHTPEARMQRFIPNPDVVNISAQEPSPAATLFEQQLFQMANAANTSEQVMVVELQLMAGAALNVHQEAEDENDRELGKRLRGFIDENMT